MAVTFDSINKTNCSLSPDGLSVSFPGTAGEVRSTVAKSTGKFYFELTFDSTWGVMIGLATPAASVAPILSNGQFCFYPLTGEKFYNTTRTVVGTVHPRGIPHTIGIAADLTSGTLGLYVDGYFDFSFSFPVGTYYIYCGWGATAPSTAPVKINYGGTHFVYPIPIGYTSFDELTPSDLIIQHYAILQDGKYYLPTQNNYNFITKDFTAVTLDYLKDINNINNFVYNINEIITDKFITNGEIINPIKYFKNFQIVKIIIKYYVANDDNTYTMYFKIKNAPTVITVKQNNVNLQIKFNSITLPNCTIELLDKFDSDNILNHKLLGFDKSDGFKFLIKYRGRYYGKDLEPLDFNDDHDYVRKAIDISELNRLDVPFNLFSLVIIFTKVDATLSQVKYINQIKEKLIKNFDSDVSIKYNTDSIYISPVTKKDYLYINITNGMTDDQTSDLEKF